MFMAELKINFLSILKVTWIEIKIILLKNCEVELYHILVS